FVGVVILERKIEKVNFSAAGGTAGKSAKTCKVTLPSSYLAKLGIDVTHRDMETSFDEAGIGIAPFGEDFKQFNDEKSIAPHGICCFSQRPVAVRRYFLLTRNTTAARFDGLACVSIRTVPCTWSRV
ncbi:MAG: hypothetical protein SO063_12795, partial [Eubacteriales bacterium]|nr:hypothetical protein [Eubacteriales bacterium]